MAVAMRDIGHGNTARVAAPCFEVIAARPEITARRAFMWQRKVPRDRAQGARRLIRTGQRDGAEQRLCIGVAHFVENIRDGAGLNGLARIHHANPVAGFQDQPKIMADEQHGGAVFPAQILDQIDHCRLDRHIQRRGRFIEDQERGFRHQGHGDDDALLLSARKLMRV